MQLTSAAPTSDRDEAAFVLAARKLFDDAILADRENREQGYDDAKFAAGEQWPEDVKKARAQRPCLTVNELPQYVRQVTGDMRMNKPSIKVSPAEDGDAEVADVYEGLIRAIENQSNATRIYVERLEDVCRSNMGFMRVKTCYANDEAFDLDLRIEGINNPFSVVWDPAATDPTLRDANFMFVYDDIPLADFKKTYPKASPAAFDGTAGGNADATRNGLSTGWSTHDTIRVAEYWVVERENATLALLSDGSTVEVPKDEEAKAELEAAMAEGGLTVIKAREVKRPRVKQWLISGTEVLSGPHDWPGDRIPIVPVWGEVYRIGQRKLRKSLITDAKDAMRMKNYAHSAYVERTALAPKVPWLVTPTHIKGFEDDWRGAVSGNPAVLPYTPDALAPQGPTRIQPAPVEAAWVQEMMLATDMIKSTTGIYSAALGQQSNETSGKAINARKIEADIGSFVFQDNCNSAIEEIGRILVNMIPRVYDAPRMVRVLGRQGEPGVVAINRQDGTFDLTQGKYDVVLQTGPSFASRRQEAADAMLQFVQAWPLAAPLLGDLIAKNMDWPDADQVAERLQAVVQQMMQPPTPPGMAPGAAPPGAMPGAMAA